MEDLRPRARELKEKAEKKLKNTGWISWISEGDKEEAAELFTKAGNLYRQTKDYDESVACYGKSAEFFLAAKQNYEAATAFVEASKSELLGSKDKYPEYILKAVDLFIELDKNNNAGKLLLALGDYFEKLGDSELAQKAYNRALSLLDTPSDIRPIKQKLTTILINEGRFKEAADIFEDLANDAISNTSNSIYASTVAPPLILDAFLCTLILDEVAANKLLDRYKVLCASFSNSPSGKFAVEIMESVDQKDEEKFVNTLQSFDSPSQMTSVRITLLFKIRKTNFEDESLS